MASAAKWITLIFPLYSFGLSLKFHSFYLYWDQQTARHSSQFESWWTANINLSLACSPERRSFGFPPRPYPPSALKECMNNDDPPGAFPFYYAASPSQDPACNHQLPSNPLLANVSEVRFPNKTVSLQQLLLKGISQSLLWRLCFSEPWDRR